MYLLSKENITPSSLYRLIGSNDYIFTMVFENDSEIKNKLGDHASAKLFYTKNEREDLIACSDSKIDNKYKNTIKVEIISSPLQVANTVTFKLDGINLDEVNHIIYLPYLSDNKVDSNGIKEIPKIEVPYEPKDELEYENIMYSFYSRLISQNISLLYEEKMEYIGLDFAFHDGRSRSELFKLFGLNNEDVQKDPFMRITYYEAKKKIKGLDEWETVDLKNYKEALWSRKITAFLKELLKGGKITDPIDDYDKKVDKILSELKNFRTTRLFSFRDPLIYLSVEGYLHIIMRHFRDTKLGEINITKSDIPYRIDDLKLLIEKIFEKISDEIIEHFQKEVKTKFFRTGSRAVYYSGDYYSFDIDTTGELISFYKN